MILRNLAATLSLSLLFTTPVFAADETLPNLSAAAPAAGTDLVPTTQGGSLLKQTVSALATYFWNSPTLVTPALGVATATSVNGLTIVTTSGTITITGSKSVEFDDSITFTGTDSTSFAFPSASGTVATLAATQTLANKTLTSPTINGGALSGTLTGTPTFSGNLTFSGVPLFTGLSAGTVVKYVGLDSGNNAVLGTPAGGSFANPSATAGPSAVNGSATTAMRSDAAPPVQKGTNAQFGIIEGDGSTITCVTGVCSAIGGAATSIVVGTTTIGSGTTGHIEYNNGGVLGELATGTAASQVVLGGVITAGGPTGSATVVPIITYNAAGQLTAVSSATITPAVGSITGLGTGVGSALADNVGSAGAPVVFNGALGTPSSGTGTNITGIPGGNLIITNTTHTVSASLANIGGQDNFNGSSLTATIPGTGTIGSGATILVTNQNATALTLTESQTVNGCPTTVLGQYGFLTGTGNGTSLDSACFPGYGTITSNALPKFSSTITGGFTASAISDNGTTVTSTEPVALTASGATVAMTGTSTGTTTIATANASGTSYTQTLPARTASIVNGPSSSTTGDCVEFNGASGTLLQDAGSACGSGSSGGGTLNYSDNGVTVTAGTYYAPPGGGGAPQSTEASVDIAAPAAATISNLQVGISTTLGGASTGFTVTLRDASAGTALTCTFNPSSATSCGDTTHSVNITKGDLIDWQIVTAGTIVGTPVITIAAANGTSGVGVTAVTGTTPIVSSGGTTPAVSCATCVTAASSLTAHGVVVGAGSQATAVTAVGTSGQVLTSNGAGNDPTFQAAGGGSSAPVAPQGRLTLQSATPVMTTDETAKSTVYYDTYQGNQVPVWNGSAMVGLTIGSDEISMGLDAVTPHIASGSLYDIYGVSNSGTLVICADATAWTNGTTRSHAIALKSGVWTNNVAATHCWGGASGTTNYGSVAQFFGTYLGTLYATANGQTTMQFAPAAASGGSNNCLCFYNAYNRVRVTSTEADSTASWTYSTTTYRPANNSTSNAIRFVDGLQQSRVTTSYTDFMNMVSTGYLVVGVGVNSTTAPSGLTAFDENVTPQTLGTGPIGLNPLLGLNTLTALETANVGGGNFTGAITNMALTASLDM